MLRWLTIIGSVVLIGAVILVARYDKFHDTEGKGYDIKCTQSSDPAVTAGTLICTAEHSQKAKSGQYDPFWWHVFFAWPEGITALLLMLTLGAITWQAWETRKAAEATQASAAAVVKQANLMEAQTEILTESVAAAQKSADVAQSSLDAMISKERALIRVKVDDLYARSYESANVAFFVYCHGLTEAFIGESRVMAEATESIDPPSAPFMFPIDLPEVLKESKTDCFVYVRNKREFSIEDLGRIATGKIFVHFWGFVKYRDVFRNERETSFCYVYRGTDLKNADGSVFRTWSKNGPPEANRET